MSAAPVWVLLDDRPGNSSQSLGVAMALDLPYQEYHICYNIKARLPAALQPASLMGVRQEASDVIEPPWPRLVISAGRRLAPIARYIGKRSGGATKLVHLMDPGAYYEDFDFLVVPKHDQMLLGRNMLEVVAPPHRLTHANLSDAAQHWHARFSHLPRPFMALIIGGDTKYGALTTQAMGALIDKVTNMQKQMQATVLVTSSRRTPEKLVEMLHAQLHAPVYHHHWQAGGKENPYMAYLALADALVVTGDSMSMIAEACFTGVPVYIEDTGKNIAPKHRRLHEALVQGGYARMFTGHFRDYSYLPLDTARDVAEEIRTRFLPETQHPTRSA